MGRQSRRFKEAKRAVEPPMAGSRNQTPGIQPPGRLKRSPPPSVTARGAIQGGGSTVQEMPVASATRESHSVASAETLMPHSKATRASLPSKCTAAAPTTWAEKIQA